MSTGYGWEGLRRICATLLGARNVPERLCGGSVYLGRYNKSVRTFTFTFIISGSVHSIHFADIMTIMVMYRCA